MAKIIQRPILELETHEAVALSKTITLLKEIARNEEKRKWYNSNVDQYLTLTIEGLDSLMDSIEINDNNGENQNESN